MHTRLVAMYWNQDHVTIARRAVACLQRERQPEVPFRKVRIDGDTFLCVLPRLDRVINILLRLQSIYRYYILPRLDHG